MNLDAWLTPLALLPGVALLIVSTAARFGLLEGEFKSLAQEDAGHAKILARSIMHRAVLFRNALMALYASVMLFTSGSLFGGFIHLGEVEVTPLVWLPTIAGVACVVFAATMMLIESRLSINVMRDWSNDLEQNAG